MKSNILQIKKGGEGLTSILTEAERVSAYNKLDRKQTLRLRLLAEELVGMLPGLLKNFEGCFWIENEDLRYELHVELTVSDISRELRDELISVSKSKKNAAATGIMGKIRAAVENLILSANSSGSYSSPSSGADVMPGQTYDCSYSHTWTLEEYKKQMKETNQAEARDELEKSIVAKLADDVIVGVKGKHVDIIIKKTFA